MFNLLRERVRRKKKKKQQPQSNKNENNVDNYVPKVSANKQIIEHNNRETTNAARQQYVESENYAERILPTAVVAAAYVGTSISDTTPTKTTTTKIKKKEEDEDINNGITAGKIYFENAHLAKTNENFAFKYNANANSSYRNGRNIDEKYCQNVLEEEEDDKQSEKQRQRVKDLSNDLMVCGFSHNVPAEWQRRVLTIGENNEILPNRIKNTTATTNTTAVKVINNNIENVENNNCELVKETQLKNEQIVVENVENNQNFVENEVKYRNLDKSTSRNEVKRQSRLSFTLAGINFGIKNNQNLSQNQNQNQNSKQKKEVDERQLETQTKLGPLQKSREYLNSLFMARGRQHQRHQRHQQQNQQQQQQEQIKNVTYNSGGATNNDLKMTTTTTTKKVEETINLPINVQSFMNDKKHTKAEIRDDDEHLEPNFVRATELTNDKNSVEKEQEQDEESAEHRERYKLRTTRSESLRSNSATILRAHSASPLPRNKRSRSVTFNEEVECLGENTNIWLNNGDDWISRTSQFERNGVENLNTDKENFAINSNYTHGEGGVNNSVELSTAKFIKHNNPEFTTDFYDMGQTNTKTDVTARDFRESSVAREIPDPINVETPTIIVADYSTQAVDKEVFYEIDNNEQMFDNNVDDHDEHDDAVFYEEEVPNMHDQYVKWQTPNNNLRHSHAKLEDVREESEEEEEEEESDEEEEEDEEDESSVDEAQRPRRHLDNEHFDSSNERSPLKSSDTTLSGSASDSGIGTGCESSQPTTPLNVKSRYSPLSTKPPIPTAATQQQEVLTQQQKLRQQIKQKYNFMSFVRDGNSTDGDEMQLPSDDIELDLADDYMDEDDVDNDNVAQTRLVCIESISLPDVVVESTNNNASNTTLSGNSTNSEHIININGATGNTMGNVHFIPIHVENSNNSTTKKRSLDDSVIGTGNSIEITEDASVMNGFIVDNRQLEKL